MQAKEIKVGQTVEITLPGVPAWNIPAQVMTAKITPENVDAIRADAADQIRNGGATLRAI